MTAVATSIQPGSALPPSFVAHEPIGALLTRLEAPQYQKTSGPFWTTVLALCTFGLGPLWIWSRRWQRIAAEDRADLTSLAALWRGRTNAALADSLDRAAAAVGSGETLSAMAAAGRDAERVVAADLRFHVLLLKSSHNELLSRMDVVIINALRIRDKLVHQPGRRWRDPVPDHQVVLDAVRQGDGDAASTAMTRLLASSEEDLRQTLSG